MSFDWAQPELSYTIYTESKAWRNEGRIYIGTVKMSKLQNCKIVSLLPSKSQSLLYLALWDPIFGIFGTLCYIYTRVLEGRGKPKGVFPSEILIF